MNLTLALVTDMHFGPTKPYRGKVWKISEAAGPLTEAWVKEMNQERPDAIVNLGDAIEDLDLAADRMNYQRCQAALREFRGERLNVAGNHDTVHLAADELAASWGRPGPLFYSVHLGGLQLVVLHTVQREFRHVQLPSDQLDWLRSELSRGQGPVVILMHHSASEQDVSDARWFIGNPEAALVRERRAFREILEKSGRVRAVFNGHLHRNHLDLINGIPYVTVQSLVENLGDENPESAGAARTPAASHAWVRLTSSSTIVRIRGNDPAKYQFEHAG